MLVPGKKAPRLCLPTVDHGTFDLKSPQKPNGSVLFFYRGVHSSLCQRQMKEVEALYQDFDRSGLDTVFVSADDLFSARDARDHAGLQRVKIAHSMPLVAARDDWHLAISQAREGSAEPAFFIEPGIFYVQSDRRLHSFWLQSQTHARPRIEHIVGALKVAIQNGRAPRGAFTGRLPAEE